MIEQLSKEGGTAMIARLILVYRQPLPGAAGTLFITALGIWSVRNTPLDALPDLSDTQVIIRTKLPRAGAADRREPGDLPAGHHHALGAGGEDGARLLVRRLLRLCAVRGRHRPLLGRSRVLEYLSQAQERLPEANHTLGRMPPAWAGSTSTPWSIAAASMIWPSCGHCRTGSEVQLKSLPNVAEVATVGGMVKQYSAARSPEAGGFGVTQQEVEGGAAKRQSGNRRRRLELAEPSTWCGLQAI
jgi:Cu(I)/Ag(I) efflux system membrane protein CusA/SilA